MTAPERINTLKLIEKQLPEGTKALDGTALRFCFVSACDGAEYAPMDAVTHDIELLKAQHARAFSAGYEAGEKDHQAALDRIAELERALAFYANQDKWRDGGLDHTEPTTLELRYSTIEADHGARAIAVLAKGDDDENPMCDDCGSRIGREGCKCPVAKGDG